MPRHSPPIRSHAGVACPAHVARFPVTRCPLLPAAVSFHPSAWPGAAGPLHGVVSLPARDQRAGRAQGRKLSSLAWVSRRGSRRLSCPWQGRALAAGCLGGCPGTGLMLQRLTAWVGVWAGGLAALFGCWIGRESFRWERQGSGTRVEGCGGCSLWAQRPQHPTSNLLPGPEAFSLLALP